MTLVRQFQKDIWCVLVRAGRRNAVLRAGILAVVAVCLFCYHLFKNAKEVSGLRYACLFCAGMLTLNCVRTPMRVWALEPEEVSEAVQEPDEAPARLEITITGPDSPIIEGYPETIPYRIELANPEDGMDMSAVEVQTADLCDVYALMRNEETGLEEEVLVYHHPQEGEETEGSGAAEGDPRPENPVETGGEKPTDEESQPEAEEPGETGTEEVAEGEPGDGNPVETGEEESAEEEPGDENPGETGTEEAAEEEPGDGNPVETGEEEAIEGEPEGEKPEETGGEEPAEGESRPEETLTMSLPRGETLSFVVRIPTGLLAGEYTETVIIQAAELEEPVKRSISFVVGSADQAGENTDISSGTPSGGATGEGTPNEGTEEGTPGVGAEEEPSKGAEEEDTGEAIPEEPEEEGSEGEAEESGALEEEEDTEGEEDGEEGSEEEEPEEEEPVPGPQMEVVSREGGYYMGNTFFAMSTAVYELTVDAAAVSALFCDLNGEAFELPLSNGYASFTLPEIYNGVIRFYTLGLDGNVTAEMTEYVIAEKTVPVLDYVNVISPTDGTSAVRVSLEDSGEIISGLNNVECKVDGIPYTEYAPNVFGKVLLCSGEEVVSGFSFDIPLQDDEIHTIEIIVADNVGNILEQSFRVHASQMDVVSVVLPTSFAMTIFPYASNGNIWGEDIVVANQSEFPVEVTLKSTQIDIDHTLPENKIIKSSVPVGNVLEQPIDLTKQEDGSIKDAKLNLNLKMFGRKNSVLELQEGYSMPGTRFVLEPGNPDTNAAALQSDPNEKSVISGDYAIVNIRGTIAEGSEYMWKDGDIAVALTFTFRRLEETE
ncbi:MAG: hypothetical protein NC242_04020 [Roseburia sp.]|nr:hypothetical protein [Roseburia sp.]MCM1429832.1 hypothetical protein [Muribaculaceae bacterium]